MMQHHNNAGQGQVVKFLLLTEITDAINESFEDGFLPWNKQGLLIQSAGVNQILAMFVTVTAVSQLAGRWTAVI